VWVVEILNPSSRVTQNIHSLKEMGKKEKGQGFRVAEEGYLLRPHILFPARILFITALPNDDDERLPAVSHIGNIFQPMASVHQSAPDATVCSRTH